MCLLEGDVPILHVLVEVSLSVQGWTGNEAWDIKQLFAPQQASWLEIQAVSLSHLHIQIQGIFAPLISVPPGPWNMGLWQRACWKNIKEDFLFSQPLQGVGRKLGTAPCKRGFPWGSGEWFSRGGGVEGSCSCSLQAGFVSNQCCTFCWTTALFKLEGGFWERWSLKDFKPFSGFISSGVWKWLLNTSALLVCSVGVQLCDPSRGPTQVCSPPAPGMRGKPPVWLL